jgi:hypothetical protein
METPEEVRHGMDARWKMQVRREEEQEEVVVSLRSEADRLILGVSILDEEQYEIELTLEPSEARELADRLESGLRSGMRSGGQIVGLPTMELRNKSYGYRAYVYLRAGPDWAALGLVAGGDSEVALRSAQVEDFVRALRSVANDLS